MSSILGSSASQTIAAIVFGITATLISVLTLRQSYRKFGLGHAERRRLEQSQDVELGELSCDFDFC